MTSTSETIIFFGNERIATGTTTHTPTLRALVAKGYKVAAIVAHNEPSLSRKQRKLEIAIAGEELGIPLLLPTRLRDIKETVQAYGAQAGVLVAYGKIIPQEIIDLFPRGIINLHPSLLPLHRGPTPLESVILNGESQTGISIMQLVRDMDAGPVYAQKKIKLTNESKQELADTLLELGANTLVETLPGILADELKPQPQDEAKATYDRLITKRDGIIDWSKPAERIEREVRAFVEWPKSSTTFGGLEVVLTAVHTADLRGAAGVRTVNNKSPLVYCGSQALVIDRIKPAGKKEITGEAFLAGYSQHFLEA